MCRSWRGALLTRSASGIKSLPIPQSLSTINIDFSFLHLHASQGSIDLGPWSPVLTVLWLVGIANAVNLIDGMDGLAAGVSAISALTIWTVALASSIDPPYAALAAAVLAGALLGFLRWNFNPARIFLGDSGAYLTGFRPSGADLYYGRDQGSCCLYDHCADISARFVDLVLSSARHFLGHRQAPC